MAKLSARGRKELFRMEREINTPDGDNTTWQRKTRAVMSDGSVLEKWDVRFKPSTYDPRPSVYSYGWKLHGKLKAGKTIQDIIDGYVNNHVASGRWTVFTGAPKPVILSASRITRAIESGENIGFCKSCGASQGGCEPDARNYRCESCGMSEVYGAEECLMSL